MRKFLCAAVVVGAAFSVAMGGEFRGAITKIEGDETDKDKYTVTFVQKKKGEEAKTFKLAITKDTTWVKGKFNKAEKKLEAGDPIEGGRETVAKSLEKAGEKGVRATVVIDGDEIKDGVAIKEVRVGGRGGKKKKTTDN